MYSGNLLVTILTVVLLLVGLSVTYFIGLEVIYIFQEVASQFSERSKPRRHQTGKRKIGDTGPLGDPGKQLQIQPFQDRKTVERLIDYFEDGEVEAGLEQ